MTTAHLNKDDHLPPRFSHVPASTAAVPGYGVGYAVSLRVIKYSFTQVAESEIPLDFYVCSEILLPLLFLSEIGCEWAQSADWKEFSSPKIS